MAAQERDMTPSSNGNTVPKVTGTRTLSLSPLRRRPIGRTSTWADASNSFRDRRSSNLSDSVDSTRQSLKSSTDDLLLPKARSPDLLTQEQSHWHSVPLALAFLPAIGGLLFNNGSVVVTDLTLLILAAIFLNWAVRLPWDWYLSTQSIRSEESQTFSEDYPSDTIIEEDSEEEEQANQPTPVPAEEKEPSPKSATSSPARASAISELRIHEILALFACFISPIIGAWLLHHIRSQLSRPSEGLVSNYNLTVFLLASEVRPVSHLIKLVQARTLHLQRTVAENPFAQNPNIISPARIQDLTSRLTDLEKHIIDNSSNGSQSKAISADLVTQTRKSVQPDFDALNRAVRRYEKRATLLSLQTESRLQDLEKRLGDAITLAAAAERSSQSSRSRRGPGVSLAVDWLAMLVLLPIQVAGSILSLPGRVVRGMVDQIEGYVGRKVKREMKTAGKGESRTGSGSEKRKVQGKAQKKVT
ncbi:hypothetical protein ACLMJK_009311 [Lecanora helva]